MSIQWLQLYKKNKCDYILWKEDLIPMEFYEIFYNSNLTKCNVSCNFISFNRNFSLNNDYITVAKTGLPDQRVIDPAPRDSLVGTVQSRAAAQSMEVVTRWMESVCVTLAGPKVSLSLSLNNLCLDLFHIILSFAQSFTQI